MLQPPVPRVLEYDRDACVARCTLGLTVYTRHLAPAPGAGAARLLAAFLECAPVDRLVLFRTSLTADWERVTTNTLRKFVPQLAGSGIATPVRHLLSFHLADAVDAPETFFLYREVDEQRDEGSGYVQLGLPFDAPPARLEQLAAHAAEVVPMWGGSGGYAASAHPEERCTAFSSFWAWARRYRGLDVHDPERGRMHAHEGLASVNWLTLIGSELLAREDPPGALARDLAARGLNWRVAREAAVVRAGPAPTLDDVNELDVAAAYRAAHRALAPWMLAEPVRFYGRFWNDDQSAHWATRYVAPAGWAR